jgi:hypothetical protein
MKSIFETHGGTYHRESDYLLKNRKPLFDAMLLSGKLNAHLEEIDRQARDMFSQLEKQIAEREGVTEELKASNQIAWVRAMNNIRSRAEEVVCHHLIYD